MAWYYGPAASGQRALFVFSAKREPTHPSHGRLVKYAVGPWRTKKSATNRAHLSHAHPGWPVFRKQSPHGIGLPLS